MAELLTVANWLLPLVYLTFLIDYGIGFFLRTNLARRREENQGLDSGMLCGRWMFGPR